MSAIKKACVYASVTSQEQENGKLTIKKQEQLCKAAIAAKEWLYVTTFSDIDTNGRAKNRPGLKALRKAIVTAEVDAIVIYKLDRLSHHQRDTIKIFDEIILKNDIAFVSLNESLDTTTPWGKTMLKLLSSFNKMENEDLQTRTTKGRKAKAEKGGYAGGKPPLGYRALDGELVIVPDEAEIVRLVFELRGQGMTLKGIAEELNKRGYRTKKGGQFLHSSVQNILNNEQTYRGTYKYGKDNSVEKQHEAILID